MLAVVKASLGSWNLEGSVVAVVGFPEVLWVVVMVRLVVANDTIETGDNDSED